METNIIFTTVPDKPTGEMIAHHLVEKQLAACVNILPQINSIYQWEGKIHNDSEYLLIIKSLKKINKKTFNAVKSIHPYEVPELIALDITDGDVDYLNWITNEVK